MPRVRSSDAFARAVEEALEHITDVEWLGNHSPLAAPYFIGALSSGVTSADRGAALAQALRQCEEGLETDHRTLIEVTFFTRDQTLNNLGLAFRLNKSESSYYRHRQAAVEAIAAALGRHVAPPLRADVPFPRKMFGRADQVALALVALRARDSVMIGGPSGVGKTTFAAHVAEQWGKSRTFWFTLRPGLTDNAASFAFTLAFFLRAIGSGTAWQQLIADGELLGKTLPALLGLFKHDLEVAGQSGAPVLMCIDEIDLLLPGQHDHELLTQWIEALSVSTPTMLCGQAMRVQTRLHLSMHALGESATAQWFASLDLPLNAQEAADLVASTTGNPGLLAVCAGLLRAGERLDALLRSRHAAAFEMSPLLARAWRRLDEDDRALLLRLCVFRDRAPADAFDTHPAVIARLREHLWLEADVKGGISIVSHARPYVEQRATPEAKTDAHLRAARIMAERGDITEACWHWVCADQPALAAWTWLKHMSHERALGRSQPARAVFDSILPEQLATADDRRALALVRAELARSAGGSAQIQAILAAESWPAEHGLSAFARRLQGDALEMQGQVDAALAHYRTHLSALSVSLQRHELEAHYRIGFLSVYRLGNPSGAQHEATLMLLKAEEFSGMVRAEQAQFSQALDHYARAMQHAQLLPNGTELVARLHERIGSVKWRAGDLPAALQHLTAAVTQQRALGNRLAELYAQLNLAAAQCVAGQPAQARALAEAGLVAAEALEHSYLSAAFAVNAAEACHDLGELDMAERLAMRALGYEEAPNRPYALTVLGMVAQARGQLQIAIGHLQGACDAARDVEDRYAEAHAARRLGCALLAVGDLPAGKEQLRAALALFEGMGNRAEAAATRDIV